MGAFTLKDLAELTGAPPEKLAGEAADYLMKLGNLVLDDEKEKREELKKMLCDMSDQELRAAFVPDVFITVVVSAALLFVSGLIKSIVLYKYTGKPE